MQMPWYSSKGLFLEPPYMFLKDGRYCMHSGLRRSRMYGALALARAAVMALIAPIPPHCAPNRCAVKGLLG